MTTEFDHGKGKVPQRVRCPVRKSHKYPTLHLALRDFRTSNGRNPVTGAGTGNESWIALTLGMVVLDTLTSEDAGVGARWLQLLTGHGIGEPDAEVIYRLRCSVLHGYGLPASTRPELGGRQLVATDEQNAYALEEREKEWRLSVPVFCSRLVERIAFEARNDWDVKLLDTDFRLVD